MRLLVGTPRWWSVVVSGLSLCLLVAAGCGGDSKVPGTTGRVSGRVTFQGNPLPAGSTVTFVHEDKGLPAVGQVTADGTYTLMMRGERKVATGSYKVSVTMPAVVEDLTKNEDAYKAVMMGKTPAPKTTTVLPARYNSPETSGLSFDVEPGSNNFDINLKE